MDLDLSKWEGREIWKGFSEKNVTSWVVLNSEQLTYFIILKISYHYHLPFRQVAFKHFHRTSRRIGCIFNLFKYWLIIFMFSFSSSNFIFKRRLHKLPKTNLDERQYYSLYLLLLSVMPKDGIRCPSNLIVASGNSWSLKQNELSCFKKIQVVLFYKNYSPQVLNN